MATLTAQAAGYKNTRDKTYDKKIGRVSRQEAQRIIAREQADREQTAAMTRTQSLEAQRNQLYAGLGSSEQLSGAYTGMQPRDLSKYSRGLLVSGDQYGSEADVLQALYQRSQRAGQSALADFKNEEQHAATVGGGQYGVQRPESELYKPMIGPDGKPMLDELGQPVYDHTKPRTLTVESNDGRYAGTRRAFDPLGITDSLFDDGTKQHRTYDAARWDQKEGRIFGSVEGVRGENADIYGQITEVNDKYTQAYELAKQGKYDEADALQAEADALTEQYGLNEKFQSEDKALAGLRFQTGNRFDPLTNPEEQGKAQLGSASGMLVGNVVNKARQMMDPNSAESMRFKDSLTSGAIAQVDQARDSAIRAMAAEERGGARAMRDLALRSGAAAQTMNIAAIGARSAERFATQRADVYGQNAAAKVAIHSDAAKMYETFKYSLAQDATALASAWVNDQSGVRDSYRQMTNALSMNYINNLFGVVSDTSKAGTQLEMQSKDQSFAREMQKANEPSTVGQIIQGVSAVGGLISSIYGGGAAPASSPSPSPSPSPAPSGGGGGGGSGYDRTGGAG